MLYSDSLSRLIDMFKKMPGIGHKSAIRLAFNIVSMSKEEADEIISTIKNSIVTKLASFFILFFYQQRNH